MRLLRARLAEDIALVGWWPLAVRIPRPVLRWRSMELSEAFLSVGEEAFGQLVRGMSIGKLKTYQLYEQLKTRAHLAKLNTENLRKGVPRFWARLGERDENLAHDLAQAILVSRIDAVEAILNFLGIPHQGGFFEKNLDASKYLTDGWQQRVYDHFRPTIPEPFLRLYINHLSWELSRQDPPFVPAG